jgi:hypothetical protein
MDEDRLTPRLGRLIDAAKSAARAAAVPAAAPSVGGEAPAAAPAAEGGPLLPQGWAVLGEDGEVYTDLRLAGALAAAQRAGTSPEAASFAVAGVAGDTVLPEEGWRSGVTEVDPHLPVVVKYLGRWVVVTLEEIPGT